MVHDYYQVLGIPSSANLEQIKAAYKSLALQTHPDKNSSPDAARKFQEINQAYEILSNDQARRAYDHDIEEHPFDAFAFTFREPRTIFREFFGFSNPFESFFSDGFGMMFGPGLGFFSDPYYESGGFSLNRRVRVVEHVNYRPSPPLRRHSGITREMEALMEFTKTIPVGDNHEETLDLPTSLVSEAISQQFKEIKPIDLTEDSVPPSEQPEPSKTEVRSDVRAVPSYDPDYQPILPLDTSSQPSSPAAPSSPIEPAHIVDLTTDSIDLTTDTQEILEEESLSPHSPIEDIASEIGESLLNFNKSPVRETHPVVDLTDEQISITKGLKRCREPFEGAIFQKIQKI